MPELPDIAILAKSMHHALSDRSIFGSVVNQPKVLNRSVQSFQRTIKGRSFQRIWQRGKWVLCELDSDWLLALNLGMGGEVRLHRLIEAHNPKKERVVFFLADGEQLWVRFWWFGHVHLMKSKKLPQHPQLGTLGPEPLSKDFTAEKLASMFEGKRGRIKSYLLDQRFIAGIGNVYIQDILWLAGVHPDRKADTLDSADIKKLHSAIQQILKEGIRWGPGPGERDVWGNRGQWGKKRGWPHVGYRTGEPCPACKTIIEELRVGSTTSYICPECQT